MQFRFLLTLLLTLSFSAAVFSQNSDQPKYEFRATWMATVVNLDWPASGSLPVRFQKQSLKDRLDDMKEVGINALFFQIRTEGDALYASDLEPWSKYLTGQEGRAPDPYWDPLEFVIEEAHKRGMELHAWLNPYRAMRTIPDDFSQKAMVQNIEEEHEGLTSFLKKYEAEAEYYKAKGTTARDSMHVANKNPEWLMVMNDAIAIMNPGLPEVIDYNVQVVMDVVNRYDIDGIHFDDYFYPYPPNNMGSNDNESMDDSTFAQYPRGFDNKGDWRRNNIDIFVEALHDSIQQVKPWVKFGISPFGIWKSGVPSGISGMDAYSVIYGDALAWIHAQTIDYITPQLYWAISRFGTGQDYKKLADWWADEAFAYDRHTYPGHGLYRSSSSTFSGSLFAANEIPRQVQHNRGNDKITGSVFFRSSNLTTYSSKGFADTLKTNYYRFPALQPIMDWKDTTAPATPDLLTVNRDTEAQNTFHLEWDRPSLDMNTKNTSVYQDTLLKYAIYRVDAAEQPDAISAMASPENMIAVTGQTSYTDVAPPSEHSYWYFITSASRNNVESEPTEVEEAGVVVSNEEPTELPSTISLQQNYPNPFNPATSISFKLPESGNAQLVVYNLLGQQVATIHEGRLNAGSHTFRFDASGLSTGVYVYQLRYNGTALTRKMMLIK
ncbi:MAG: family 10 glycosylhydrolase [Balneolaceae bacterium]|nr:family 10 glycosylhydrolase [Balneolaceae bacterium]